MTSNSTTESGGTRLPAPRRCGISCLLLAIVFVSGILAGGGLTVIFHLDEEIAKILGVKKKPKSFLELRDKLTDRYAGELDLAKDQKEKMREIFTEQLKGSIERRARILEKITEGMNPILSEAQKAKWEQIKTERLKKWNEGMPTSQPAD